MLLASPRFATKADDVLAGELEKAPILSRLEKIIEGNSINQDVALEEVKEDRGGMMLYTSGTTNRPVSCDQARVTENTKLKANRKAYSCLNQFSWLKQSLSIPHGTTRQTTISSTSFHSTTFMAP